MRERASPAIGAFLRALRRSYGLKQHEIAAVAGVSQPNVSRVERCGTTPETEKKYLSWIERACKKKNMAEFNRNYFHHETPSTFQK